MVAVLAVSAVDDLLVAASFVTTVGAVAIDSLTSGADRDAAGKLEFPQPAAKTNMNAG